jgi:hypothetical protein
VLKDTAIMLVPMLLLAARGLAVPAAADRAGDAEIAVSVSAYSSLSSAQLTV